MDTREGKVFIIGLPRTGTRSVAVACGMLGIDIAHAHKRFQSPPISTPAWGDVLSDCDGAADFLVPKFFPKLDRDYPGSKFIFTHREPYARAMSWARMVMYQKEMLDGAEFKVAFEQRFGEGVEYTGEVIRYFEDRPGDILMIDITKESDPWSTLCRFLGKPKPFENHAGQDFNVKPFPHVR